MTKDQVRLFEHQVLGDAATTGMATGAASELLSAFGKLGAGIQQNDQNKANAAKATQAQSDAQKARNAAQIAALQAMNETDPSGPLHIAAFKADADAKVLEQKAGMAVQNSMTTAAPGGNKLAAGGKHGGSWFTAVHGGLPLYGWGLVTLGVAGVGALVVHMVRGSGRR